MTCVLVTARRQHTLFHTLFFLHLHTKIKAAPSMVPGLFVKPTLEGDGLIKIDVLADQITHV